VQGGTTLSPLITAWDIRDRLLEIHDYPDDWIPDALEQLSRIIRPCHLDEHVSTLIARSIDDNDDALLLNLAQLLWMVGCRHETDLLTALALLEQCWACCWYLEPGVTAGLLDFNPDNDDRPMLSNHRNRMLELLCSDKVSWAEGRCALGKLVAYADPRYRDVSMKDSDDGYSQQRWSQERAVLGAMPEGMLAEEMGAVALSDHLAGVERSPGAVAPALPLTAGSSPSTPVTTPGEQGWTCTVCDHQNSDTADVCDGVRGGSTCGATRSAAARLAPGATRSRKRTEHLQVSGGSSQSYESPGGAPSSSGGGAQGARAVSSGRARGSNTPGRGKGRAGARGSRPPSAEAGPQPMSVESMPQPDVCDLEEQLDALVGMPVLKTALRRFQQTCRYAVSMRAHGHAPVSHSYHALLMGNPGTGKTTVARLLFGMLKSAGVLKSDAPFVEIKASHAEGAVLGEAREKAQANIDNARGGVLFVDEAHQLTMHKDNLYGQQVAAQLMDCLQDGNGEDDARRVIVIYAGYVAGMQTLITSDEGCSRRIHHRFTLPDYTPSELAEIFLLKMAGLKRGSGEGVTVATVSAHIEACTNAEYRSSLNGTIAEVLLEHTDAAMCDRLRGNFESETLSFEVEDVALGAEALKAAFEAAAGPATTAAHAAAPVLAASPALANPDGSSSDEATDGEDARTEARALDRVGVLGLG
jgi:hypothetical protein